MMVGLEVSKIKFAKNVNREIWEIQRKEIPNSSTQKKKKTQILLDDRVKRFKKQIWKGSYYICTICHRNFSWCSVHYFSIESYNNFKMSYIPATTFDIRLYVYLACHKSVSKGKLPCQAVCNKLKVEAAPKVL